MAVIKADKKGRPFVHIRVSKQTRIFGEIIFRFGEMVIKCRECHRWHRVRIMHQKATMEPVPELEEPAEL